MQNDYVNNGSDFFVVACYTVLRVATIRKVFNKQLDSGYKNQHFHNFHNMGMQIVSAIFLQMSLEESYHVWSLRNKQDFLR
jgi:hypothetical protein